MPARTHQEMVLEEIVRQWPERVEARARLIQRPLGVDAVSDTAARELYWKANPNPPAVMQAIAQQPDLSDWQITTLMYPERAAVLEAVKNERGINAMIQFDQRMQRQGPPGTGEEPNATTEPRETGGAERSTEDGSGY